MRKFPQILALLALLLAGHDGSAQIPAIYFEIPDEQWTATPASEQIAPAVKRRRVATAALLFHEAEMRAARDAWRRRPVRVMRLFYRTDLRTGEWIPVPPGQVVESRHDKYFLQLRMVGEYLDHPDAVIEDLLSREPSYLAFLSSAADVSGGTETSESSADD